VPGYANPQALNRYSYVLENPLRYTDPTGHCSLGGQWIPDTDAACQWSSNNQQSLTGNENGGFVGGSDNSAPTTDPDLGTDDDILGNSEDANNDIVDTLYQLSDFTQDMATLVDMFGVAMVFGITGAECAVGLTVGGVEGLAVECIAGDIEGVIAYNVGGINVIETGFSLASLALNVSADGLDDGQLGEASYTSVTTFVTGLVMVDPFSDLIIDGYASGYNHGYFNDIYTILNGGSLFVP